MAFEEALSRHLERLSHSQKIVLKAIAIDLNKAKEDALAYIGRAAPTGLNAFVERLDGFFKLIKDAVEVCPDIAKIVWAAVYILVNLGRQYTRFFDEKHTTLQRLADDLDHYSDCNIMYPHWHRVHEILVKVYDCILSYFMLLHRVFIRTNGHGRKLCVVALQPFNPRFRNFKTLEETSKSLGKDMRGVIAHIERKETRIDVFRGGLRPNATVEEIHASCRRVRIPGSGEWLLKSDLYFSWRDGMKPPSPKRILWCYGKPGCGKSVIASLVIDDLKQVLSSPPKRYGIGYTYWSRTHGSSLRGLTGCLQTMVYQLVCQLFSANEHMPFLMNLVAKYDTFQHGNFTTETLMEIILLMSTKLDTMFLVFDGVDELEKVQTFLWARTKIEDLERGTHSANGVQESLATTPGDMEQVYEKAMARIDKMETIPRQQALAVLSWVLVAQRPLSLAELNEAVRLDEYDGTTDSRALVDLCHPLCHVELETVAFLHTSVIPFLERYRYNNFAVFETRKLHLRVFKICKAVLSTPGSSESPLFCYSKSHLQGHREHAGVLLSEDHPPLHILPGRSRQVLHQSLAMRSSIADLRLRSFGPEGRRLSEDTFRVLLRRLDEGHKGTIQGAAQVEKLRRYLEQQEQAFFALNNSTIESCVEKLIANHEFNIAEIECARLIESSGVSLRRTAGGNDKDGTMDFDAFVVLGSLLEMVRRRFSRQGPPGR